MNSPESQPGSTEGSATITSREEAMRYAMKWASHSPLDAMVVQNKKSGELELVDGGAVHDQKFMLEWEVYDSTLDHLLDVNPLLGDALNFFNYHKLDDKKAIEEWIEK